MGFTMLSVDTGCKAITLTFIIKRYAVCMISRQKTPPVRQSASDAEVCRRSTLLIKQPSCSCFAPLAVRASREMSDINDEFMKGVVCIPIMLFGGKWENHTSTPPPLPHHHHHHHYHRRVLVSLLTSGECLRTLPVW